MKWLPIMAPKLPIPIPVVVGAGKPDPHFNMNWSILEWIDGANASDQPIAEMGQAAEALGTFGACMRRVNPGDGPSSFRGGPVHSRNDDVVAAISDLGNQGTIDGDATTAAWEQILQLPQWEHDPVWTHSDLHPGNLVVNNGRLCAVIDFGGIGLGDPACDIMVAWTVLDSTVRSIFREHAQIDDQTWERGRGWAFAFGLTAYHYHRIGNPTLAGIGWEAFNEALAEFN